MKECFSFAHRHYSYPSPSRPLCSHDLSGARPQARWESTKLRTRRRGTPWARGRDDVCTGYRRTDWKLSIRAFCVPYTSYNI